MPTLIDNKVTYQGGEALPSVGSSAYVAAQNGQINPLNSYTGATPPPSSSISSSNLSTSTPYNIPPTAPAPTGTTNLGAVNNSIIGTIKADASYTPPTTPEVPTPKDKANSYLDKILGSNATQAQDIQTIKDEQGLTEKKQKAIAISNELDQLDKDYRDEVKAIKEQSGGNPAGQSEQLRVAGERYDNRRANIALTYKVAAGDYNGAQEIANEKINTLKDSNAQNIIAYQLLTASINNDLTESEKIIAAANITRKENQAKSIETAYGEVLKNMSANGSTPASVYNAVDAASKAPNATPASIYQAAGQYGGDTLDRQYKQAQINKLNADAQAAISADATVNPDVLQGMLNVYKSTGVLPAFGMSAKSPLRAQFYAALGADGSIVTDANTNKTIRAGLTTAYKTQQNQLAANQTAIGTLDQQLGLVQQYSDQVNRSSSPLVNKYLIGLKTGVFGDPDTAALNNIVKTASYEFAKILSGSAASISGVTVTSAADAESMLNSSMSKGQFTAVIGLMKKEADFRLNSQKDTLNQLEKDMNNVGKLSTDLQNSPVVNNTNTAKGQKSSINGHTYVSDGTQWVLSE